tara:strand:+ start:2735 stop:2908 length:174 start_codon:yes stop_codon:yes gene_type:complete
MENNREKTTTVYQQFEGRVQEIELADIEEILSDNPSRPNPTPIHPYQSVKAIKFGEE